MASCCLSSLLVLLCSLNEALRQWLKSSDQKTKKKINLINEYILKTLWSSLCGMHSVIYKLCIEHLNILYLCITVPEYTAAQRRFYYQPSDYFLRMAICLIWSLSYFSTLDLIGVFVAPAYHPKSFFTLAYVSYRHNIHNIKLNKTKENISNKTGF